jgi:hypothetical protein
MYHNLLINPSFHALLNVIDDDLAEQTRQTACLACGGPLHQANYPRSPLGLPLDCREYYEQRRSFCCGACRMRVTTPSVRFFGRYRFPAPTIVLLSLLKRGATKLTLNQVRRYFGVTVSKRTWKRWRRWWHACFITTIFWKQAMGMLPIKCLNDTYPRSFLFAYQGTLTDRLVAILGFLAPLTAGIYRAV